MRNMGGQSGSPFFHSGTDALSNDVIASAVPAEVTRDDAQTVVAIGRDGPQAAPGLSITYCMNQPWLTTRDCPVSAPVLAAAK
jgi:hypothetical protein